MGGAKDRSSRRSRAGSRAGATSHGSFDELAHEVAVAGGTMHQKLPQIYRQDQTS